MNLIGPQIQTASGRYFNLLEPDYTLVCVEDIAAALSKLCRYTGHCWPFYSVAEHCVRASFLVPPQDRLWALLHDAAEAYLGDVSSPLKQLLPDYKAIEVRVEDCVFSAFGLFGPIPASVKVADLIMLATEKRDLMPAGQDWEILRGVTPLPGPIHPWAPALAEGQFLERADMLLRIKEFA